MKPHRLLIVNWRDIKNPEAGGAELHLHQVALRLAAAGFECLQYAHSFPGAAREETVDGIRIFRRGSRRLFNFTVWFRARSWIRRHKPDIIIDDSNKIPFFLPWLTNKPVVVRIHHLFRKVFFQEAGPVGGAYLYCLERLGPLAWKNRPVITVSDSSRKELSSLGVRHITVAQNGVDGRFFHPGRGHKKPCTILYVGRVKQYKSIDVILQAIADLRAQFPEIQLQIVGRGDGIPRLRKLAGDLELDGRVQFLGFVSEEDKARLYAEATVLVNTSLKEGYGLTGIEANACGTVVVATNVPGLRDSVRDGDTGFLVSLGDRAGFRDKIGFLLKNPEVRRRMEKQAMVWAAAHKWENTFRTTRNLLQKELENGSRQ